MPTVPHLCTIAGHPVSHQEQHPDPVGPIWATLPSPLPSGSSRLSIGRVTSPRSSPTLSSEPGVSRCLILNWANFLQVKIQLFTAFLPTTAEICPRYELYIHINPYQKEVSSHFLPKTRLKIKTKLRNEKITTCLAPRLEFRFLWKLSKWNLLNCCPLFDGFYLSPTPNGQNHFDDKQTNWYWYRSIWPCS